MVNAGVGLWTGCPSGSGLRTWLTRVDDGNGGELEEELDGERGLVGAAAQLGRTRSSTNGSARR